LIGLELVVRKELWNELGNKEIYGASFDRNCGVD
jgi:hypothetical protein